jgi:hypothetical protein
VIDTKAKARIASGEYEGKFGAFLLHECNELSSSRAYELIAVAEGTKTVESLREETNARKQKFREGEGVRSGTESNEPQVNQGVSATKSDNSPPQKKAMGRPAAPKTPEARLSSLIAKACKGLTADQLQTVLQLIRTP